MNKPVHISSNNKINYDIEMYTKPEEIYVPLENKNGITYKHLVKEGDYIYKGNLIGHVGPKYVYGVVGNQYSDKNGIPTNGATTGCHLHFGYRIDGKYANPLDLFQNAF